MKPTLKNVAELAGTSIATVSRALSDGHNVSEDVRLKINKAVKQIGYKRKSYTTVESMNLMRIAAITNDDSANPNSFYYAILSGLRFECNKLGIEIDITLIDSLPTDVNKLKERLEHDDAIILIGMENPEILRRLHQLDKHVQLINGSDSKMQFSSISPDYEHGGYLAGKHLLDTGNRANCIITANVRPSIRDRQVGFMRAHQEVLDSSVTVIDLIEIAAELKSPILERIYAGETGGDFGAKYLMPYIIEHGLLDNVDGVFCACDLIAISVMHQTQAAGLSPMSIIGFDDLPIATLAKPQLTTVRSNYYDLAKQGLSMLIHRHAHGNLSSIRAAMAVELVKRQSVIDRISTLKG